MLQCKRSFFERTFDLSQDLQTRLVDRRCQRNLQLDNIESQREEMPMKFIQHHSVTSEVGRRSPSLGKKLWTILTAVLATCLIHTALVRAELASEQEMLNVSQNFVTQKVARIGQWAGDAAPTRRYLDRCDDFTRYRD